MKRNFRFGFFFNYLKARFFPDYFGILLSKIEECEDNGLRCHVMRANFSLWKIYLCDVIKRTEVALQANISFVCHSYCIK